MDDIILADIVKKKRSGPAKPKGNKITSKPKHQEMDDDTKLVSLKSHSSGTTASEKCEADSSITEMCKPGVGGKDVKALEVAKPKSTTAASGDDKIYKVSEGEEIEDKENLVFSAKRKRGADAEILKAYLSSPEKISRFRPRKEVPAFRMVDLDKNDYHRIVGKRVKVYWPDSRRWFAGCIKAFDRRKNLHSILYEDGDKEELDLIKERFQLEIIPSEGFNVKVEPKSQKKGAALDNLEVNAGRLQEESVKTVDAENVIKSMEPDKKGASAEVDEHGGSMSSAKDIDINEGVVVAGMDVDMKDEKVIELSVTAGGNTVGFDGNDSECGKGGETLRDEPKKTPVKKRATSWRKALTSSKKKRKSNLMKRKAGQKGAVMMTDAPEDQAKLYSVQITFQGEEAVKVDLQGEDNESIENKNDGLVPLIVDVTASNQSIVTLEDGKCEKETDNEVEKQPKMEVASEGTVNVAANVEIAVLTVRPVQEKVIGEDINAKTTSDAVSGEGLKERSNEVPNDATTQKNPDESTLGNLSGKLNQEKDGSDGDKKVTMTNKAAVEERTENV